MPTLTPTIQSYDHAANIVLSGLIDSADTFKLLALGASYAFDSAHTTSADLSDAIANWPEPVVNNVVISIYDVDSAEMTADSVTFTAGADLTDIKTLVLIDTTKDLLLSAFVFVDPFTRLNGSIFTANWADGYVARLVKQ